LALKLPKCQTTARNNQSIALKVDKPDEVKTEGHCQRQGLKVQRVSWAARCCGKQRTCGANRTNQSLGVTWTQEHEGICQSCMVNVCWWGLILQESMTNVSTLQAGNTLDQERLTEIMEIIYAEVTCAPYVSSNCFWFICLPIANIFRRCKESNYMRWEIRGHPHH
jgi:hypothetical protein